MTDRNFGQTFSWWIAEVVNVKDPDESGRVQVRVVGRHDDTNNIPDADLPWALPLQSVTSAAFRKIGTAPVGMVKGTKVIGFWADSDQQYPIIIGTFGKAGPLKEGTNTDGIPEIDFEKGSMPAPAQNADAEPYNPQTKLYTDRVTIKEIDKGLVDGYKQAKQDLEKVRNSTNSAAIDAQQKELDKLIAEATDIPKQTGVKGTEKSKELNKDPKKATTASVDRDSKSDIIEVVKQADPESKSATLPNMLNNYTTVRGIMNLTSPGGIANMLGGALTNGLMQLAGQLGVGQVLGPLVGALGMQGGLANLAMTAAMGGNVKGALLSIANNTVGNALRGIQLDPAIKGALYTASSALLTQVALNNGSMPKYTPPSTSVATNNTPKPAANLIVGSTELQSKYPLYIQQFYTVANDPFPGYIEWKDKNGNKVYTLRNGEPNYASAEEKIQAQQGAQIANQYSNMLKNSNSANMGNMFKSMLAGAAANIASAGISAVLGNGVNMNSILGLASKLLPSALSGAINGIMRGQLPQSFLNVGMVAKTMSSFTINQALLAAKKQAMTEALTKSDDQKESEIMTNLEKTQKDLDTVKNSTNPFEVDMATRRLESAGGTTGGGVTITRDGMGGGTLSVSATATQVGPGSTSVSRSGSATFNTGG